MVLESVAKPAKMERHPYEMFLLGFIYSTLGLLLAFIVFEGYASMASVFITTIPLIIVMMETVKYEEEKDYNIHEERFLLREHGKALSLLFFLFMGMVVSYSFWYAILPYDYCEKLFSFQINILKSVEANISAIGNFFTGFNRLEMILANNLMVLFFCILFSFLYGAGAVFILTLNASVIGVAVGSRVREYLSTLVLINHAEFLYHYFNSSVSFTFCYMLHGVFEVSAYIVGALAGGIISVAVVNHDFRSSSFWHIVADSFDLILLSLFLLVIGCLVEVYITPPLCSGGVMKSMLSFIGL